MSAATNVYERPAELLQNLIRFNTTNPPGNEAECVDYISDLLKEAGLDPTLLALDANRPNLIARLEGAGNAPPLLLYGHVDVVAADESKWQHPPFAGEIADGYVWGRGALDMKGGVAMLLAAFLRAKEEGLPLPGDVILAVLSDEEAGGDLGAKFLVEQHAGHFEGVRYALGEFGGFSMDVGGQRFYPVMVAEKQICWLKLTVQGPGGHGSMPVKNGAMAKLGRLLQQLDEARLPVHITPVARQMIESMATAVPFPTNFVLRQLLKPSLTDGVLGLLGERGRSFAPLLHNTVSATIVRGGNKINVIPGQIEVEVDGRLLPGYTPDDLTAELRQIVEPEVEFELLRHDPGPAEPDMALFDTLADVLRQADPGGLPVPLLLSGVTDARFFSQLGIQTYGFLPMSLPSDFNFIQTVHAADERIPVDAIAFGTNAIYTVLQRFGED